MKIQVFSLLFNHYIEYLIIPTLTFWFEFLSSALNYNFKTPEIHRKQENNAKSTKKQNTNNTIFRTISTDEMQ